MAKRSKGGLRYGEGYVMERQTAGGEARYVARWREPDGKGDARWRGKTFRSADDAEDHLRLVARQKRAGTYVEPTTMTVSEAVTAYIESRAPEWRSNTVRMRRGYQTAMIDPHIGGVLVMRLTTATVQTWLNLLARSGMAHGTIGLVRSILSAALADLVRIGVLPTNPVTATRAGGSTATEVAVWSVADARAVIAATADDPELHAFYRLALTTGMRPGELRGLQWDDLHLDAGYLIVARTVTRSDTGLAVMGTTTKTGHRRTVRLDPDTVTALTACRRAQTLRRLACERWQDLGLVFAGHAGGILHDDTLRNRHRALCERIGVTTIKLHGMRHTYASIQAEHGVPQKVVMDIMGHTHPQMNAHYTHTSPAMLQDAALVAGTILGSTYPDADVVASDGENGPMHTQPHTRKAQ